MNRSFLDVIARHKATGDINAAKRLSQELTALGEPGDQCRLEVGAGRVNRRGISGGTGTEDEQGEMFGSSDHMLKSGIYLQKSNTLTAPAWRCRVIALPEVP